MVRFREAEPGDLRECARICFEAFSAIAAAHGFPPDLQAVETIEGYLDVVLHHPGFYAVVSERDGCVIGSNFLDERSAIAAVGPVTVDCVEQDNGVGRGLMEAVLTRAEERGFPGVRLVQAAYHSRSMALYAKLGFEVREPLAAMQGTPPGSPPAGLGVRPALERDVEACGDLCFRVHGYRRTGELGDAMAQGTATVVERLGQITGYTTGVGFFGHTVGETTADVKALIAASPEYHGPGVLVPTRNAELFRWCLSQGLRIVEPMTLMSRGLYNEPRGAFLPSILC